MTLSEIVILQNKAEALHRLTDSERTLWVKAIKTRRNATALGYRKGWYNKAERMRARASARAREALFARLG